MKLFQVLFVLFILIFWVFVVLTLFLGFTLTEIVWHYGIVLVYLFLFYFMVLFQVRSGRSIVSTSIVHNLFFVVFLLAVFVRPSHHYSPALDTELREQNMQESYFNFTEARMNNEFEEADTYVDMISRVIFNSIKEADSKFQGINVYSEIVTNIISAVTKKSDKESKDRDVYFDVASDFIRRVNNTLTETKVSVDVLSDIAEKILVRELTDLEPERNRNEIVVSAGNLNPREFQNRKSFFNSEQITVLNFYNVDENQILQAISSLIAEEKYYAAQEMLVRYYSIFGVTDSSRYIAKTLASYLETGATKESRQREIEMEIELVSWREVLENSRNSEADIIVGYRTLLALSKDRPEDERVSWLLQQYIERIEEFTFFAGELRLNMASRKIKKDVSFTLQNEVGALVFSADSLVSTREAGYFRDLELVQMDGAKNTVWSLQTPYAKAQKNILFLAALERNTGNKRHVPTVVSDGYDSSDLFVLSLPIQHQELRHVFFEISEVELWQVLNMIFFWTKASLPLNELYIYIVLECLPALILLIGGYIIMNFVFSGFFRRSDIKDGRVGKRLEIVLVISSIFPIELLLRSFFGYMAENSTTPTFQKTILASFVCYVVLLSVVVFWVHLNSVRYRKQLRR